MSKRRGQLIRRYRVGERLGEGAMGEVFKAYDTRLEREVALKRLPAGLADDQHYRRRFLNGARHAARLNHPCIAEIHDFFEDDGQLYLVMELVEGRTLDTLELPLPAPEFLKIAVQCAEGLAAAHKAGIVHQDLKPRNIMVDGNGRVKILDFGIARRLPGRQEAETAATQTTIEDVGGTPAFMAPEVLLGEKADQRADLFSLGVVFYQLLSGEHPFPGKNLVACINSILHREPTPLQQLSPDVGEGPDAVVRRLLAKDPDERTNSAETLLEDLRELRDRPSSRPTPPQPPASSGWKRLLMFGSSAVLLILAVAVWWGTAPGPSSPHPVVISHDGPFTTAVLPFSSTDSAPTKTAFAAGLQVSLSERLAHLSGSHGFHVMPPFLVAGRTASPEDAGMSTGAGLALSAVVEPSGTEALVRLRLEETGTGRLLKTAEFSGPYSEPTLLELELAERSLRLLDLTLTPRDRTELAQFGTAVEAAYHFYLQGQGWMRGAADTDAVESALEAFENSLSLDGRFAAAAVAQGRAHLQSYRLKSEPAHLEAALQSCRRGAELTPESAEAQLCLGEIALAQGRLEAATDSLRTAQYLNPNCYEALSKLADALAASGQRTEAAELYRQAQEHWPGFWHPHYARGVLLYREARLEEAADEFEAVTSSAPQLYGAWTNLAAIYSRLAQYGQGRQAAERSIAIKPTGKAYSNLATALFYQGQFSEAVETYQQSLVYIGEERGVQYFTILGNLAESLYWAPGADEKAREFFNKALEAAARYLDGHPDSVDRADTLGRVALYHVMLGENEVARRMLQKALEAAPSDPETLFKAGIIHMRLGEPEAALSWLEKALQSGIPLNQVRRHPAFQPLRENPRFQAFASTSADAESPGAD